MKKTILTGILLSIIAVVSAQDRALIPSPIWTKKIIGSNEGLHIGGYGQIDFNLPTRDGSIHRNGTLDVHRFVTFIGYNFNEKTSFVSEIEFEHVSEVFVEQAFLNYRLENNMSLSAGLMLVPMGIKNLYHEPPTFNGVERTNVDKYIVPTTWREMGISLSGRGIQNSLNYKVMMVNGFNGYDGEGVFSGKTGLRSGRQKGAKSYITFPDFAARVSYYGYKGLNLGLSAYLGDSESTMYDGLDLSDDASVASADSTIIGIQMIGADARYKLGPLQLRGQYIVANLSNTDQYNGKTDSDLASVMAGYYSEIGYNLLNNCETENELIGFCRYENYNTHVETAGGLEINEDYNRTDITFGLGFKVAGGAMFKADYQILSNEGSEDKKGQFNFGTAIWF